MKQFKNLNVSGSVVIIYLKINKSHEKQYVSEEGKSGRVTQKYIVLS